LFNVIDDEAKLLRRFHSRVVVAVLHEVPCVFISAAVFAPT
jgi:hypothetical protein